MKLHAFAAVLGGGAAAAAVVLSGCGGSKGHVNWGYTQPEAPLPSSKLDPLGRERPEIESFPVANVPERTIGPFMARGAAGGVMVAYLVTEGNTRKVIASPLEADGKLGAAPRALATASGDVDMFVLRPTGGNRSGFVGLWTSLTERGEAVELLGIGNDGSTRGQPIELGRTSDDVVWVEAVPTARGAICVWAEETRDQTANIVGVALDPDGKPRGVPTPIAKGVVGWQAVPTTMGAGLALVTRTHALQWLKLDGEARPVGPAVDVSRAAVGTDVDVVRAGSTWTFAWTDRSGFDPQVVSASLDDAGGAVRGPTAVVTSMGGAKFVGMVPMADDTIALAWDETGRSGRLHLTKVAAGKPVQDANIALQVEGNAPPVLTAAGRGVALLVNGRACARTSTADACAKEPAAPMFVRLDASLAPVQVEPLRTRDAQAVSLAWGLDCGRAPQPSDRCLALAANSGIPVDSADAGLAVSQVVSVNLTARTSPFRAPIVPPLPADAPRPTSLTTVASRDGFTDLAAVRSGDDTLLALVSAPSAEPAPSPKAPAPKPAPKGPLPKGPGAKAAPLRPIAAAASEDAESIRILDLDSQGAARDKPALLTNRALSMGGVAMAPAPEPEGGAVVAWVARDAGDPQVHLARVDRHGKKLREQRITNERGDASDVAIGLVSNGWVVAWVDGRDGNGEVYAAHVSPDLRVTSFERVTRAPGDASDLTMLVQGERVWLAFADPRDSPHDGFADIYVAVLRASDAKRQLESRVLATAAHSRSPVLAPSPNHGVAVGWIEEAPMGAEPSNSAAFGAMVAWLDDKGTALREPIRTGGAGSGFPTAILFTNEGGADKPLRAIVARSTRDELWLDALELPMNGGAASRVFPVLALSGPPSLDISLAFLEGALFYNDGLPNDERVRRLMMGWN